MKLKINEFNADLAKSVAKYNNYIAKNDKIQNIEPIIDHVVGGSGLRKKSNVVLPYGDRTRDIDTLARDYSMASVTGVKVNRLKKAKRWIGFSKDTASDGIGLADQALDVYDKHDAKKQAMNKGFDYLDGGKKKKKINRLKKAEKWRDFSVGTVSDGIGLGDKAWTAYDKHDAKTQAINKGFEQTDKLFGKGTAAHDKKLKTAMNRLVKFSESTMTKPTKDQISLLEKAGVLEAEVSGGCAAKKCSVKKDAVGGAIANHKKPNARAQIVKKVMAQRGIGLIEASKAVKAEGLY